MAAVRVETEMEAPRGWVFRVAVESGGPGRGQEAEPTRHDVTLSWADYEYWSHGAVAPERVVKAVVEAVLASRALDALPPRFDASTARRWVPDLDRIVREAM